MTITTTLTPADRQELTELAAADGETLGDWLAREASAHFATLANSVRSQRETQEQSVVAMAFREAPTDRRSLVLQALNLNVDPRGHVMHPIKEK